MSIWTRICGSVMLEKEPDKFKLGKKGEIIYGKDGWAKKSLPFPEEQISTTWLAPRIEKEEAGWHITISRTSYPIIKQTIEKLIGDLPSGESETIYYNLKEDSSPRSSSGGGRIQDVRLTKKEKDIAKRKILERIGTDIKDWGYYNSLYPIDIWSVDDIEDSILTIHDSVRWCEAKEMYKAVIKFFKELVKAGIMPIFGNIVIQDDSFPGSERYELNITSDRIEVRIWNQQKREERWEIYKCYWWWGRKKGASKDEDIFPAVSRLVMEEHDTLDDDGLYGEYDTLESLLEAEKKAEDEEERRG